MAKPTDLPNWATDNINNVEPSAGKQADGWANGEDADSSWFNWWMNLVYMWIAWLDGLFDANSSLTLPSNSFVKVQGTGSYKHGTKTITLSPNSGIQRQAAGLAYSAFNAKVSGVNLEWCIPIPLPAGKRITAIRAKVKDHATGPQRITVALIRATNGASESVVASANTTGTAGTLQTVALAPTETIVAGKVYEINYTTASGAGQTLEFYEAEVDYDEL